MNILVRKLEGLADLPAADAEALLRACSRTVRIGADRRIIEEGDRPDDVMAVLEGWAYRYKILKDGRRQILAFLMPGDFCDLAASVQTEMDHSIGTLTPVVLARIPRTTMETLLAERPALTKAFLWAQMVDEGVLRAWIVSLGRRDAFERVAHLLCELWSRARSVGLMEAGGIQLPITQAELSDALGLTAVHTNRVLGRLRDLGLVELRRGLLNIPDGAALGKAASFEPGYLHRQRGSEAS